MEQRIFFRRKALLILREYWLKRWDNLALKEVLSLKYTPKYYIESEHLEGNYIKIKGLDFIWYKGVFSKGIHLKNGKYYKDAFHYSNIGIGPREMVFPINILKQLNDLSLIGNWTRYQLSLDKAISKTNLVRASRSKERVKISVDSFIFTTPRTIIENYWKKEFTYKTLCIKASINNEENKDSKLLIPLREIHWNSLLK